MALLQPTSFMAVVASSKEQLNSISEIISRSLGQSKADVFLKGCDNYDSPIANSILNETVKELTGCESFSLALNAFTEKFPQLSPDLGNKVSCALSEVDKVKVIDSYRLEIINIINRKC